MALRVSTSAARPAAKIQHFPVLYDYISRRVTDFWVKVQRLTRGEPNPLPDRVKHAAKRTTQGGSNRAFSRSGVLSTPAWLSFREPLKNPPMARCLAQTAAVSRCAKPMGSRRRVQGSWRITSSRAPRAGSPWRRTARCSPLLAGNRRQTLGNAGPKAWCPQHRQRCRRLRPASGRPPGRSRSD